MNHKSKGAGKLVAAVLNFILSMILFFIVDRIESDWTYSFDKDAQLIAALMTYLAWGLLVFSIIQLIEGIAHCVMADKEEEAPNTPPSPQEKKPAEISSPPQSRIPATIDHSKLDKCIFCGKLTDRDGLVCQHCGRRKD